MIIIKSVAEMVDELQKKLSNPNLRTYEDTPVKYKHVRYYKKYKCITIDGFYHIPTNRITTAGEVLDWIHQLHEKNWVTDEIMREFIDMVFRIVPEKMWAGGGE